MLKRARRSLTLFILAGATLAVAVLLAALMPVQGAPGAAAGRGSGLNLTLTDRPAGIARAVALVGNEAYVGLNNEVVVVDVTNMSGPLPRGRFALTGTVTSLAAGGGHVYASAGGTQLQIISVANPDAPAAAGTWQAAGPIQSVTLSGNTAFLAMGAAGLRLLDVTNPQSPQPLGSFPAGLATQRARVFGGRAYVVDVDGTLAILDISNLNSPTLLGSYNVGGPAADVHVNVNDAFVSWSACAGVNNCQAMFTALNVTQVTTPTHLRTRTLGPGAAATLAVSGGYAYVSRYGTTGVHLEPALTVLDVSVPLFSNIVATYNSPGAYGAYDVVVSGVRAFLANGETGLHLLSVSDPLNPALRSILGGPPAPAALAWHNGHLLALAGDGVSEGGLWGMVPAGDGLLAAGVGVVPALATAVDLAVADGYAYALGAATDGNGVLVVLDVSNPAAALPLGGLFMGAPLHVAANDGVAVVHDTGGLRIYNVANPTAPAQVGAYTPAGDVAMAGQIAYVAAGGPGLHVLDLSQPSLPVLMGSYNPTWQVNSVAIAGSNAIVGRGSGGIAVIDVSNPANPRLTTELPAAWVATNLTLAGDYLLASTGVNGVQVINLVNPQNPIVVGTFLTPGTVSAAGSAGQVYIVDQDGLALLTQQYRLAGSVRLANGQPWAGAVVSVGGGGGGASDGDGAYAIDGNAVGAYTVTPSDGVFAFWPAQLAGSTPPDAFGLDFVILSGPVTTTVTAAAGGQLTSIDPQGQHLVLDVPPGAVLTDTTLVLTPIIVPDEPGYTFAAHAFDLVAYQNDVPLAELTFAQPATLTTGYSDLDVAGIIEAELAIWWGDSGAWSDAATGCDPVSAYERDLAGNNLILPVCVTGRMALFGPRQALFLPVVRVAP